jgi:hypothetical protein
MRKRLVALLSLVGFANSAAPAASQVLKGSNPAPETKNESQVKGDKIKQEDAAVQNDASKKLRKAGGEQQATQDVVTEKIGPDHVVHKHIAGVKYEDGRKADAASKDAAKVTKATKQQMGDGSVKPGPQTTTGTGKGFGVENPTTIGSATGGAGAGKIKFNEFQIKGDKKAIQAGIQDKRGKVDAESSAAKASIKAKDKWKKTTTESLTAGKEVKGKKVAAEANAAQSEAAQKPKQTTPK